MKLDQMASEVTFLRMPRSKPKTSAEGQEQLSNSLARMASAPVASRRVPITEVGFAQCRFVVDDRSFPALCCGEPTLGGSWCAQHRALVFVRVAAAPNHRKSTQEPPKAPASTAETVRNGPGKRVDGHAIRPALGTQPAGKQRSKPQDVGPSVPKGDVPVKSAKALGAVAKKDGAEGAERGVPDRKEVAKTSSKTRGKPAPAGKRGEHSASAGKVESARKRPAAKTPAKKTPAKKTSARKGGAATKPAPAKKAATSRKSSPAKRPAPAKQAASRKAGAGTRPPAKTSSAARKGTAAKQRLSAKKTSAKNTSGKKASGKRKTR